MNDDNPRLTVSLIIPSAGRYWYVKNKKDGLWGLPGGKITLAPKYEYAQQAGIREAKEELGVETKIRDLIGIYQFVSSRGHPVLNIVYSANITRGTPRIVRPEEISEIEHFTMDEIERMHQKHQLRGGKANIYPVQEFRAMKRFSSNRVVFLK